MSTEGDMNSSSKRSPSPKRTDAEYAKMKEEEISKMEMDLLALEKVITQAKHEAAAMRQRLGVVEESDNDRASRGNDLPALEAELAYGLAHAERSLIDRGLSYLDNALTVERLLRRETGHRFVGPTSTGGRQPRNGRFQDIPHRPAQETAPDYNEQRESVLAAIDALAPSQETEDTRDDSSHQGER